MAAVTAAVVAGVATTSAAGYSAYQQSQTPGSGHTPAFSNVPQDPLTQAIRGYAARTEISNQATMAPSFASELATGDATSIKTPWVHPGLTPQETTAFGLTGGAGQAVPYVNAPGTTAPPPMTLTPQQRLYLARQRQQMALQAHTDPNAAVPGSMAILNAQQRVQNLQARQARLAGQTDLTPHQLRVQQRIANRLPQAQAVLNRRLGKDPLGSNYATTTGQG